MKRRWIGTLLLFILLFSLCACGQTAPPAPKSPPPPVSQAQLLSAVYPVEDRDFRETEDFPMPFSDPWASLEQDGVRVPALTLEQALYDYAAMWALLEENFPYLRAADKERLISADRVREQGREALAEQAQAGIVPLEAFSGTINDTLSRFRGVGHLSVLSPWGQSQYANASPEEGGYSDLRQMARHEKIEAFYRFYDAAAGGASTVAGQAPDPMAGVRLLTVGPGVPCVQIPSWAGWTEETYQRVGDFLEEHRDAAHIILDMRGNDGGQTWPWQSLIVLKLLQGPIDCEYHYAAKDSALHRFTDPHLQDGQWSQPYDPARQEEWFPGADPEYLEGLDRVLTIRHQYTVADPDHPPFAGKLWVLMDKACFSASDGFATFCKRTGFATLVGELTGGNGVGNEPLFFALPYSGLCVRYDPYMGFNPDGTCNGTVGTRPDIWTSSREALTACLEAIAAESGRAAG